MNGLALIRLFPFIPNHFLRRGVKGELTEFETEGWVQSGHNSPSAEPGKAASPMEHCLGLTQGFPGCSAMPLQGEKSRQGDAAVETEGGLNLRDNQPREEEEH